MQYFATTLFDEMEENLVALTLREERRAVDEYSYYLSTNSIASRSARGRSPLSQFPNEKYILGYLQNNPDGSFQTPLVEPGNVTLDGRQEIVVRLKNVNTVLNTLKIATISEEVEVQPISMITQLQGKTTANLAEKYLNVSKLQEQKTLRVKEKPRTQRITVDQVFNIAQEDQKQELLESLQEEKNNAWQDSNRDAYSTSLDNSFLEREGTFETEAQTAYRKLPQYMKDLHVEVDPMQSVLINDQDILIFRRIMINNQVYRQGFVLSAQKFLNHLITTYFTDHPMVEFTKLRIEIKDQEQTVDSVQTGVDFQNNPILTLTRVFPRPFSFLQATITCTQLPNSTGRKVLDIMRVLMGAILLLGLVTIYQSARTIVDLSERRSMFVSSVTHELKTPLTNIRMYIEMLEQGIAPNREREEEYFRILGSETRRLSRLIDNVLEFSKLEKKQRRFNVQEGNFEDVIREVRDIMQAKLRREGFLLTVEKDEIPPFRYDREVMVQVLLNLIENSLKFGKTSPMKEIRLHIRSERNQIKICVVDSGPGIPRSALKKVFDDFYRVENDSTQAARGTGIGLALVKKFIAALGGTVEASNNEGAGCRISISLPA